MTVVMNPWSGMLCGLLMVWAIPNCAAAESAPFRPSNPAEVLERLPPKQEKWQGLADQPKDHLAKAGALLQQARRLDDPRLAFAVIHSTSMVPQGHRDWLEAMVLRARARQYLHDFDAALADLDMALAQQPIHAEAGLLRATILTIRGRTSEAIEQCKATAPALDLLPKSACLAAARAGTRERDSAYRSLLIASATAAADQPPEIRLWALQVLGDIAVQKGDWQGAEAHYRDAIATDPDDHYAIAQLADLLVTVQRPTEAVALLTPVQRTTEALLLKWCVARKAAGMDPDSAAGSTLADRVQQAQRNKDDRHLREHADYLLHLTTERGRAADLAHRNWQISREAADARLLVQASSGAGRRDLIDEFRLWADETGFSDAKIEQILALH